MLFFLKDANSGRDDVVRKIRNKGDIALLEGVFDQEGGEVGAGENCDFLACVNEVGGDGVLLMTFDFGDEDVSKRCGARFRGDAEDNVCQWGKSL